MTTYEVLPASAERKARARMRQADAVKRALESPDPAEQTQ